MTTTTWSRIEPSAQTTDLEEGLAARIADPLWLLARQRQLGEFHGDDGGSPIGLHFRASWSPLTRYHPGPLPTGEKPTVDGVPFVRSATPLEALIEGERPEYLHATRRIAWADRVRLGRRLEENLRQAGEATAIAPLRVAFPFQPDPPEHPEGMVDRRYRALLPGQIVDGANALAGLDGPPIPATVEAAATSLATLRTTIASWLDWARAFGPPTPDARPGSAAWIPDRLEYAFAVAAPGFGDREIVFEAAEYDGTGIDWYSTDVRPGASLGAAADAAVDEHAGQSFVRHVLPQPVTYPGMPADRFWQMEDGHVNLGAIGAGPTDLARMLAVEYAIVYGPDWFIAPLELPTGCVARVDWVVVRDTFGALVVVGTTATQEEDQAGRQFQPSSVGSEVADNSVLFLPGACGPTLRGRPLERLVVLRDELANLAWGIEHVVLGPAGRPIDRRGPGRDASAAASPAGQPLTPELRAADLIWRLATPAPAGWVPLVAVNRGQPQAPDLRLVRARLLDTIDPLPRDASGQLLGEIDELREEEVGRAGVEVTLLDQVGRWIDGSTVAWRGREKRPGRGEAESRLFFDRVDQWRPPGEA